MMVGTPAREITKPIDLDHRPIPLFKRLLCVRSEAIRAPGLSYAMGSETAIRGANHRVPTHLPAP
jgi:hypothetical protein